MSSNGVVAAAALSVDDMAVVTDTTHELERAGAPATEIG
jgi:hypothetical protein